MKIRTYADLSEIVTFEERYEYLRLDGSVGESTFGYDRYINQAFYKTAMWKRARQLVVIRDNGCDLGIDGYEIHGKVLIHHMNPISRDDLLSFNRDIIDTRFLICTSERTHQAIHYGDRSLLPQIPVTRRPGDTILWRR